METTADNPASRGWSAGQYLVGIVAAGLMGVALFVATGLLPIIGEGRTTPLPSWAWPTIVVVSLLIGVLAAAYSSGGWGAKLGTLIVVVAAGVVVVAFPALAALPQWSEAIGLPLLQPLMACTAVLALLGAVVLVLRQPVQADEGASEVSD